VFAMCYINKVALPRN